MDDEEVVFDIVVSTISPDILFDFVMENYHIDGNLILLCSPTEFAFPEMCILPIMQGMSHLQELLSIKNLLSINQVLLLSA